MSEQDVHRTLCIEMHKKLPDANARNTFYIQTNGELKSMPTMHQPIAISRNLERVAPDFDSDAMFDILNDSYVRVEVQHNNLAVAKYFPDGVPHKSNQWGRTIKAEATRPCCALKRLKLELIKQGIK